MYLLLTDETNVEPSTSAEFFVTGGLFFPIAQLSALHADIAAIRAEAGYRPRDTFKFNTHDKPAHVSQAKFKDAKAKVLTACRRLNCKFIAYVVLHKIAKKTHKIQWGLDAILRAFDLFLREANEDGIAMFDRPPIPKPYEYLVDKFVAGLQFPHQQAWVSLDRIKLFGTTCINASHANSAMDIVLGSFRYAINERSRPTAGHLMRQVAPMMWSEVVESKTVVEERGLILRPLLNTIKVDEYAAKYVELTQYFYKVCAAAEGPSS